MNASEYLWSIMPSREDVRAFVDPSLDGNNGWTFDAELGWVHCTATVPGGVDNSQTYLDYESDGARKILNGRDRPCRIHTYGDSFTHCDQVNDGETWQETLAAHLQEPIRNYGVGGYSVYQAYRRMRLVEKQWPAEYIILNIWCDDHYRNLDAWRSIRLGRSTHCGFPLPHLRVDAQQEKCEQVENIFATPDEVLQLCDEGFVMRTFENDHVLQLMISLGTDREMARTLLRPVYVRGEIAPQNQADAAQRLAAGHTDAALYATQNVVKWTQQFVEQNGKKLLVVLSYSQALVADDLAGQPRFDQSFIQWLETRPFHVIDMRDVFRRDFEGSKLDSHSYLQPYYIGHHTPAGNFFTAWALKAFCAKWLDPPPLPYR